MLQTEFDNLTTIEATSLTENFLFGHVMLNRVEPKLAVANMPAGESSRGFLNVMFRVIANAKTEEFHHLTGEVFVRMPLAIRVTIKPQQHCHIFRDAMQHAPKAAERFAPQQVVLSGHQRNRINFRIRCRKVIVPQQRQLLDKRIRGRSHPM